MITQAQNSFAGQLRDLLERDPIAVSIEKRSAEAIVRDLLQQAEEKGKSSNVALYLVGAILTLRFKKEIQVHPASNFVGELRSTPTTYGDFKIENTVISVVLDLPNEDRLNEIAAVVEDRDTEVWLLTKADRTDAWMSQLKSADSLDRVVVRSIEAFVGQNITELGRFSVKGKAAQLLELFELYNSRWIEVVGTPGIRIVAK